MNRRTLLAGTVGAVLVGVLGGATGVLAVRPGQAAALQAVQAAGRSGPVRPSGIPPATSVPPGLGPPTPTPAVPTGPTPARAVPATTLLVAPRPLDRAAVQGLTAAGPLTVVLAGTVEVAGGGAAAVGVSPAGFRDFMPGPTRKSAALWTAVSQGQVAVSFALARARHLRLGSLVRVHGVPVRIAAEADFRLPQAALVVSLALAARLGLHQEEVLLDAPSTDRVARVARALLGSAEVISLVPPPAPANAAGPARPTSWRELYADAAATCPGLPWTVLAAIGQIESADGHDDGPSSAGALGPMQFLPSTWAEYGYRPQGGGAPDVFDPVDAVYSAARLLCADGAGAGPAGLAAAVFDYNHAGWYVREVLALAAGYARLYGS